MKLKATYAALAGALLLSPVFCSTPVLAAQLARPAAAVDQGKAPLDESKDVLVSLKLPDRAALEAFVASTVDPSSANYHKFLTTEQFKARFGRTDAEVARVRSLLESHGLTVSKVYENNLVIAVRGTNAQLAKLFATEIHTYTENGETYQKPASKATVPAAVADLVQHVAGLSTRPLYHSYLKSMPTAGVPIGIALANRNRPANAMPQPGIPGQYTVTDVANMYNLTPVYKRGFDGTGQTLGIMTFASFKTSDVSAYWAGVGLSSDTSRITTVNTVPGSHISSNGADETTLDVEQSGGLASGAKVIVYEAPNTSAGEVALYTGAITANHADTLSVSWGLPEVAEDPDSMATLDGLFLEAAANGVPIMAASADSGAYDLNNAQNFPYPDYSATLSVDFPASSPYVLAAGGTTLPATLNLSHGSVTVPAVRPWAWDYLAAYMLQYDGQAYYYANIYPVGAGGGVSVNYALPSYQQALPGTMTSAPGQSLFCFISPAKGQPCTPGEDLADLPGGFAGRNVPDLSLDADPETGFSMYYGGQWGFGSGGTSFVAPQLNGIFSVITQQAGHRLGQLQPQLYSLFKAHGYAAGSPFTPVASGDNWFYVATPSYNPATGIGQINADALANGLSQ
ncbi:MAG: S8/S53 family peptidase [Proteobacteria bacterium]|nr:S8/S53 family peptidase [Pseudomonadota bacterium]